MHREQREKFQSHLRRILCEITLDLMYVAVPRIYVPKCRYHENSLIDLETR